MPVRVPEEFRHLLDAPVATLATVGKDGRPQLTAVSFLHDKEEQAEDIVRISLNDTRQKTKNLRSDPRATLFVLDPATPYRTLEIRADVELAPDPDFEFARIAGAKYGQDFHRHDLPGETRCVVTLRPVRINVADLT